MSAGADRRVVVANECRLHPVTAAVVVRVGSALLLRPFKRNVAKLTRRTLAADDPRERHRGRHRLLQG